MQNSDSVLTSLETPMNTTTTTAQPIAELKAVSKSYKTAGGHELKVLENIDLAVQDG